MKYRHPDVDHADMREVLPRCHPDIFDAVVTDPPYEIGFMGKAWDKNGIAFDVQTWREVLRVLKPGANAFVFAHPKKAHRVACAIEDAGFQIQDTIAWFFTTGMPKTKTDLKPAYEPIIVARKPGEGRLYIERCLVPYRDAADLAKAKQKNPGRKDKVTSAVYAGDRPQQLVNEEGRRPTNAIADEGAAAMLGEPSRILYVPKARGERLHPTEKPLDLMRYLVRLATPPGGCVLDPFAGSGTTIAASVAEGMTAYGIELDAEHAKTANARLTTRKDQP